MAKHNWEPTDTEGHTMECLACGLHICIFNAEQWDASIDAECPRAKVDFAVVGTAVNQEQYRLIERFFKDLGIEVEIGSQPNFDWWLQTLPDNAIDGFNDKAVEWISSWGNGGGDYSTEECVKTASPSDNPREWAQAVYGNIVDYCATSFEAASVIMSLVDEVLSDDSEEVEAMEGSGDA